MIAIPAPTTIQATEASVSDRKQLARHINDLSNVARATTKRIVPALYGTYAQRPSASLYASGTRYVCSDGIVEFVNTGSSWAPLIGGVVGTEAAPLNSMRGWTAVGAATTTTALTGGCAYLYKAVGGAGSALGFEKTRTTQQSITVHVVSHPITNGTSAAIPVSIASIWVRDTGSGKLVCLNVGRSGSTIQSDIFVMNLTNLTTFAATPFDALLQGSCNGIWLRLKAGGTSITAGYSFDGRNFFDCYTDAVTFLGAGNTGNAFGFGLNAAGAAATFDSVAVV